MADWIGGPHAERCKVLRQTLLDMPSPNICDLHEADVLGPHAIHTAASLGPEGKSCRRLALLVEASLMVGFTDDMPLPLPRRAERLSRHCCMSRVMRCSKGRKSTPSSCTSTHAHNYYLIGTHTHPGHLQFTATALQQTDRHCRQHW